MKLSYSSVHIWNNVGYTAAQDTYPVRNNETIDLCHLYQRGKQTNQPTMECL